MKSLPISFLLVQAVSFVFGQSIVPNISSLALPSVKLGYLDVPGASLYYEVMGTGPLVLFISGGNGACDVWRNMALFLQANFTVAIYDRRGFSRSYLSTYVPQDYEHRLETDVEDAAALLKHLSPNETATVLGTSSGAIVALQFLITYPKLLKTLVSHEVPAIKLLPDKEELTVQQNAIYTAYRAHGIPLAMAEFGLLYKAGIPNTIALLASMDGRNSPYTFGNDQYWLEREMPVYPFQDFNLTVMGEHKGLLMPANGNETDPTAMQYRANAVLAQKFGLNITFFPGSHVGYQTDPQAWAVTLATALAKRNAMLAAE